MSTATDEGERQPARAPERYLLDRPQRFGILPTWWLWNRAEHWRLVRWPFAAFVVALMIVLDLLAVGPLVYVALFGVAVVAGTGLLEVYVRRRARPRRGEAPPALAEHVESSSREPGE